MKALYGLRQLRFITLFFCIIPMVITSYAFSQENGKQHSLDSKKQIKLKNNYTETELLEFIKEDHNELFNSKDEYINFILDKTQSFKGSISSVYAEICFRIAELLTNDNKNYKAYEYLDKTSSILETKDISTIAFAAEFFEMKGTYLYNFRRYDESKVLLLKALDQDIEDGPLKIGIYNTLGLIHRESRELDLSILYFSEGLKIAEGTKNDRWIGIINGNLGFIYYLNDDFVNAKTALIIDKQLSLNNKESESALIAIAALIEINLTEGDNELVESNMTIMDSLIGTVSDLSIKRRYYYTKTLYWEHLGEFKKAYDSYRQSVLYKDSLDRRFDKSNLQNMIFQIEFQKKRNENELLIEKQKRKGQFFYALVIILSVIILACVFIIYQLRKRKRYERKVLELEKEKIQIELKRNELELTKILKSLVQKNEMINTLNEEIHKKEEMEDNLSLQQEKSDLHEKINSFTLLTENDLIEFKQLFDKIHPNFYDLLTNKHNDLTNAEGRLAMLIRLNLSSLEMSRILGISQDSVRKSNLRLRKKLNITSQNELIYFIKTI